MLYRALFSCTLAVAASLAPAASAAASSTSDWPMFRGSPGLIGVAEGKLPPKLELLWSFKTGGPVKSSPAVSGGQVFVGSDDGHLHAIDLKSGKEVWKFKTKDTIESSPLVLDGKVFFGSSDAFFYALDAKSGTQAWRFETGDKILGSPNWIRSPKGGAPWVLVGSYDFKLYCFDSATGKTNWVYETGNYINGSPAVAEGKTMFGGCDALLHVIALDTGEKVKEIEAGAYIAASGAADGNRVYIGHYENEFLCIDIAESKVAWSFKDRNFPYFSSPALTKDRVIFGGRDKRLHCLRRDKGEEVWAFPTQGKVDSSPVVCDGKVVFGSDDGRVYMVSLADGKELWQYEIGQAVASSPAVADGKVIVGSDDGSVYCFGTRK